MLEKTETFERKPGPVRLRDIAGQTGYDISKVSRALRGQRRWVSQAVVDQVRAAAADLGYEPALSHPARRLALQKYGLRPLNHAIAVLMPRDSATAPSLPPTGPACSRVSSTTAPRTASGCLPPTVVNLCIRSFRAGG